MCAILFKVMQVFFFLWVGVLLLLDQRAAASSSFCLLKKNSSFCCDSCKNKTGDIVQHFGIIKWQSSWSLGSGPKHHRQNSTWVLTITSRETRQLKKLLAARTGLQPADQQLTYKGRPRGNTEYLDACGVKNKSKLVLAEDPASLERRYIERQKNAKIESANRAIGAIALEVDKLADQVTSMEKSISRGNKVAEVQITTLIELLMRHAVKLESIPAVGDSSSQRNIQAKRVQKCVETLDMLKVSNGRLQAVVVTTKWETFDAPATTQWELFD